MPPTSPAWHAGHFCEPVRAGPNDPLVDTPPLAVVATERPGYAVSIDVPGRVEQADSARAVAKVAVRTVDFVRSQATLAYFYDGLSQDGGGESLDERRVRGLFTLGRERSVDRDVAFGIRQLVDIAERALSPGVNDPTTAVHCVDTMHDLLDLVDDAQRRARLEEQSRLLEARLQSDLPETEHAAVHRTDPAATMADPRRPSRGTR